MKYGLADTTIQAMHKVMHRYADIDKVVLYGSRAKGNFKPGSDIDLTVYGEKLNLTTLHRLENDLDDLMLPYKIDLSLYDHIENLELLDHIRRVGLVFFERSNTQEVGNETTAG